MNKKIALDALQLSDMSAGVGNYQYNLINELKNFPFEFEVFTSRKGLIAPSDNMRVTEIRNIRSSKSRLMFQAVRLGKLLDGFALVHHLDYMTPLFKPSAKSVVTVHDLSFCTNRRYFTKSAAAFKRLQLPRALKNSDAVITVSEFTKSEILKYFPKTDGSKIIPVHLGVGLGKSEKSALPDGICTPFVLFVGTVEPRKNIISLIKSMEILWDRGTIADLVIAGKSGWLYEEIFGYAKASRHSQRIKFTGYIDAPSLEALYGAAEVFAFPSSYEGFGLPPLEAMRRNLAVVCANRASMPEVLDGGALFADSIGDAAEKIGSMIGDSPEKQRLKARGYARSLEFTWRKTAEKTAAVYEKLLSE